MIADCQLPILDWPLLAEPIGNRQSQIENLEVAGTNDPPGDWINTPAGYCNALRLLIGLSR